MSHREVPDITVDGQTFDVGDVARITILTYADDGEGGDVLANPSALVVQVQPTGSAVVTYTYGTDPELTRTTTGTYVLRHLITAGVKHQVRAVTTGNAGAEPGFFDVRPSNISA